MQSESKLSKGKEIKEVIQKNEITFAFIKPAYLEHVREIVKILKDHNLNVIYSDKIRLSEDAIHYIYSSAAKRYKYFPEMKKVFLNHDVVVMMVGGESGKAVEVLSKLKSDGQNDGIIRRRFRKTSNLTPEERVLWEAKQHPRQDEIDMLETTGNVIHTANTLEEALKSAEIILGKKFEGMKKKGNLPAELWELFEPEEKENNQ